MANKTDQPAAAMLLLQRAIYFESQTLDTARPRVVPRVLEQILDVYPEGRGQTSPHYRSVTIRSRQSFRTSSRVLLQGMLGAQPSRLRAKVASP